uniref:Cupin type-1 domain-containing protein n=1 Tax=Aegilops tauschii subsp. strangulata TaxID=200361 RepID=A0A453M5A3_AEGTS
SADHPSYPGFPCKPASAVVSDDFFFAGLARSGAADAAESPFGSSVTSGNVAAFPGLNTLGVSINRVDLAPGGVNPLHSHPRAAELVHVVAVQHRQGGRQGRHRVQQPAPRSCPCRAVALWG